MDHNDPILRPIYIFMAAIAGAVTSLSMLQWRSMPWREILFTIFVGAAFAIFGAPWIAVDVLNVDDSTLRTACFITYAGGTCANALIPLLVGWAKKKLGMDDGEPK